MSRKKSAKSRVKCDVDKISFHMQQTGNKAMDGIYRVMKDEAQKMMRLARAFAPIDDGDLESAIKVEELGGGRGAGGRFSRKSIRVYIDGDVMTDQGIRVDEYAMKMHELLDLPGRPGSGFYRLGPKSQAKALVSEVGGKFMERAFEERYKSLMTRISKVVSHNRRRR
ncbi:hypothetical protein LJC19_08175 [Oxalobacter sp. OttesenSCG-928-P03]|nr:hypothetical protein [Oxalobacter sp. OttesenSCG-928-P03]